jgi:hypothetical protein
MNERVHDGARTVTRWCAVAALVCMSLAGVVVATPASALTGTAVTIGATPKAVSYAGAVKITGVVTRLGTTSPLANRRVVVQRRVPGGAWSSAAPIWTNAKGVYSRTFGGITRIYEYRAVAVAQGSYAVGASGAIRVNCSPALVATFTPVGGRLTLGDKIKVTGTVKPYHTGAKVVLQVVESNAWHTVASVSVGTNGTYAVGVTNAIAGSRKYRVVAVPGVSTMIPASSSTHSYNVFKWYYLFDYYDAQSYDGYSYQQATVNGILYPFSVILSHYNSWAEWNLNRQCVAFSAVVGVPSYESSSSAVTGVVYADQLQVAAAATTFTHSGSIVNAPMSGALRIRIAAQNNSSTDYYTDTAFGNARVLCSAPPGTPIN